MHPSPGPAKAVALAVVVACVSCGGSAPPTNYYVLDLPSPEPAQESLDHTAVVMPLRAGSVIRQGRIVYRESPEQVGYYEYHRWAEDPEDSVGRFLAQELMARGTFAAVVPFDGKTRSDFLLRGELRRLEEIDYDGPVHVRTELALELVEVRSGRLVWSGVSSHTEPVASSEVRSVVSGMSAAVGAGLSQLAAEIDRHLRSPD